ncbi:hypothetical protein [Lentzea indica]|uniref:hypothetical protein n=1 Tax=Lentzea indica TaxID=2604800 RepID=UPI001FE37D6C|nr:hypothetical protein [Lentzea indica]
MDANELVRGYLVLGLRLGRLVSGFVDSFTGDPALSRGVDNEPRLHPRALAGHARLLRGEVPGSDLADQRKQFLQAHLTALECTARKLAGERITFVDESSSTSRSASGPATRTRTRRPTATSTRCSKDRARSPTASPPSARPTRCPHAGSRESYRRCPAR